MPEPPADATHLIRQSEPCAVVIFGASGDLTHRKLIPALWNLQVEGRLPKEISIVGMARTPKSNDDFRREARKAICDHSRFKSFTEEQWQEFAEGLHYLECQYDEPASYEELKSLMKRLCDERGSCGNSLFYLATPPSGYEEIIRQLGAAGLSQEGPGFGWARIIVEKPFGRNLETARSLNHQLRECFQETQIYRIDHYLGKETVQNLLALRFANGIFEPVWNRRYVDHVQISVAEELGVEGRGAYYEESGALRDMVQNHLMQVLCLVAMEPPARYDHESVRNEKSKVLEAIRPITREEAPQWTARGQYSAGEADGKPAPGYLEEKGVDPHSCTETYAAVKMLIDNWRWADVPFYLRSGKRLPKRVTEISIHFRRAPLLLFRDFGKEAHERNVLTIRIQPEEGVRLRFGVKVPGQGMEIRPVTMSFDYCEEFKSEPPEAYERLLLDCMLGDVTLFSRDDWMDRSWQLMDPILESWSATPGALPQYPSGTWGPEDGDQLLSRDGHRWRVPD